MSSSLIVQVCEIAEIKEHPNADRLEIAVIKGWDTIVKKGEYKASDSVVYIPPDSILPLPLVERLGVGNYLAGKDHNRVKCARLRGEMSFGLVIANEGKWDVGTDVAEHYGIEKYIPPIRVTAGDAAPDDALFDKYTDIENIRNFPDVIQDGEIVVVTEKIDGTNCRLGFERKETEDGKSTLEWKAGSHKVKRKMPDEEDLSTNTYWYGLTEPRVKALLEHFAYSEHYKHCKTVTIYGEVYGRVRGGHKSLHYGKPDSLNFIIFDIQVDGKYLSYQDFVTLTDEYKVHRVPILAVMKFSLDKVKEHSTGDSVLAKLNGADHMREGCVVKPIIERRDPIAGRVVLKFLNDDYLILKNKKEAEGEIVDFTDE